MGICSTLAAEPGLVFGPLDAEAHGKGPGLIEWFDGPPPTAAASAWTVSAWVRPAAAVSASTLVAGFGDGIDFNGSQRFLAADTHGWFVWLGTKSGKDKAAVAAANLVPAAGTAPVAVDRWQHLAATYDGTTLTFYLNGTPAASAAVGLTEAAMQPLVAPPPAWREGGCFRGPDRPVFCPFPCAFRLRNFLPRPPGRRFGTRCASSRRRMGRPP